jgi:hypothetical protein
LFSGQVNVSNQWRRKRTGRWAAKGNYDEKQEILSIYERYPREVKAWYKDYEIE